LRNQITGDDEEDIYADKPAGDIYNIGMVKNDGKYCDRAQSINIASIGEIGFYHYNFSQVLAAIGFYPGRVLKKPPDRQERTNSKRKEKVAMRGTDIQQDTLFTEVIPEDRVPAAHPLRAKVARNDTQPLSDNFQ